MGEDHQPSPEIGDTMLDDERSLPTTVDAALVRQGLLRRGVTIGRYVILETVGSGAMGVVYAAYDPDLDRKLAIKLLVAARRPGAEDSAGRTRLVREAQAMAKLAHPHVVTVHDVGTFHDQVFVVMEFVDGATLGDWLEAETRSQAEILDIFRQAGRGLAAAHAKGLVHRDFKPDNVLLGKDGRARVGDFGIARTRDARGQVLDAGESSATPLTLEELRSMVDTGRFADVDTSGQLTEAGARIGTPAYMAPEQHLGKSVDARADQFAFCVALWEALYGQRPFKSGDTVLSLSFAVCSGQRRPPPGHVDVPAPIRRALERGLEPDPDARFEDMNALLSALDPPARRSTLWIAVGAAAVLVAGPLGAWWATRDHDDPLESCQARARDDDSWNEPARERLRRSFSASGSPLAATSASRVVDGLDDYQERWRTAWNDACGDTFVDRAQSLEVLSLRQRCLVRRHDAFAATVQVLAAEDGQVSRGLVEDSIEAVSLLPRFEHCADPDALVDDIAPPPPPLASQVADIRTQLERVHALLRAAQIKPAVELATKLERRGREIDYVPVQAETLFALGMALGRDSQLAEGRKQLEASAVLALGVGHHQVLGEASNELIVVVGERQSNYDAGLVWARVAEGLVKRWPGSEHEAEFRRGRCITMADTGRVEEAWEDCETSVVLATELWGETHPRRAGALRAHGKALFMAGRHEAGLDRFREALSIQLEVFGEGHPKVIGARNAVAVGLYSVGQVEPATQMLREVVTSYEALMGVDHELTAINRNNLAQMELELDRADVARTLALRSLEGLEAGFGDAGHPGIGASLIVLGQVAESESKWTEAQGYYARAHAVFAATRGGHAHPNVIDAAVSLAEVELALGRPDKAVATARRAVQGASELDPSHVRNVGARLTLARAQQAAGDRVGRDGTLAGLRKLIENHELELDDETRDELEALSIDETASAKFPQGPG